jgi:hypothetical protein
LARLIGIVIDGLLAQDDERRLFLVDQCLEKLGHGQGLQLFGGFDQDGAVGTDGHRGAQGFLAFGVTARDGDHFRDQALFLQPHSLFDSDLVEGVHAHPDVGDVHARAIRLDADLYVVVHHALDGYENFHG